MSHKPRSITRENTKRKRAVASEDCKLDIRSVFGYLDPTPFYALNNIEKEGKNGKQAHGF